MIFSLNNLCPISHFYSSWIWKHFACICITKQQKTMCVFVWGCIFYNWDSLKITLISLKFSQHLRCYYFSLMSLSFFCFQANVIYERPLFIFFLNPDFLINISRIHFFTRKSNKNKNKNHLMMNMYTHSRDMELPTHIHTHVCSRWDSLFFLIRNIPLRYFVICFLNISQVQLPKNARKNTNAPRP